MTAVTLRQTQKNTEDIQELKEENKILKKQIELLARKVFKEEEIEEIII
jgi:cell division protein FtsB